MPCATKNENRELTSSFYNIPMISTKMIGCSAPWIKTAADCALPTHMRTHSALLHALLIPWSLLIQPPPCVCGAVPEFSQGEWSELTLQKLSQPTQQKKKSPAPSPADLSTPTAAAPRNKRPMGGGSGHGSDGSIGSAARDQVSAAADHHRALSNCSRVLTKAEVEIEEFAQKVDAGMLVLQVDKDHALVKFARAIQVAEDMWRTARIDHGKANSKAGEVPLKKANILYDQLQQRWKSTPMLTTCVAFEPQSTHAAVYTLVDPRLRIMCGRTSPPTAPGPGPPPTMNIEDVSKAMENACGSLLAGMQQTSANAERPQMEPGQMVMNMDDLVKLKVDAAVAEEKFLFQERASTAAATNDSVAVRALATALEKKSTVVEKDPFEQLDRMLTVMNKLQQPQSQQQQQQQFQALPPPGPPPPPHTQTLPPGWEYVSAHPQGYFYNQQSMTST